MPRIGVISDTHGLLRPEAIEQLAGCVHIIHGGDVGKESVLSELAKIAPVTAVRGNNDHGPWAELLPLAVQVEIGGVKIHVVHDRADLKTSPAPEDCQLVVTGHSHKPEIKREGGVLFLNPGSAGPRRFKLPVSLAEVRVQDGTPEAKIVGLAYSAA